MTITLNGTETEVAPATTVADLLTARALPTEGVAVAVNAAVVRAADWAGTPLAEGDRVEVVLARQGG
ncbi:MAG: sulfur carrier protein ThiS [Nocardioidaceae bacterium]